MKKIFLFFMAFSSAIFVSCEDQEPQIYNASDGTYVYFADNAGGNPSGKMPVSEEAGAGDFYIEVGSTTVSNVDRSITIVIEEEGTTALPSQYVIDPASLVIPAGQYIGKIKVSTTYDALPAVGIQAVLKVRLTGVEGSNVVTDQSNDLFELQMFRSCPKDITLNYIAQVSTDFGSAPSHNVTFVPTQNENEYNISSSWGPNFVAALTGDPSFEGQFLYPGTLLINCDNTVEFTGPSSTMPGGEGSYLESSGLISIVLQQSVFTEPFTVNVTFIPVD